MTRLVINDIRVYEMLLKHPSIQEYMRLYGEAFFTLGGQLFDPALCNIEVDRLNNRVTITSSAGKLRMDEFNEALEKHNILRVSTRKKKAQWKNQRGLGRLAQSRVAKGLEPDGSN